MLFMIKRDSIVSDKAVSQGTGYAGLCVMVLAFLGAYCENRFFQLWVTPICWVGYIFFVDHVVFRIQGRSLFLENKGGFLWMWVLSIPLWLVFEYYNLLLKSWEYVGLPPKGLAVMGMCVAFATILPALFETASLVNALFRFERIKIKLQLSSGAKKCFLAALGIVCLILPLIFPSTYICGLIWLGFLLLLDPINDVLGIPSFLKERKEGKIYRFVSFIIAGYICGFVWELWNWHASSRWIYHVPFLENIKIFEMPVLGFLGFGPFSLEMFAMYYFAWYVFKKLRIISSPCLVIGSGMHTSEE